MTQKQIITLIAKWFNLTEITELSDYGGSTVAYSDTANTYIGEITSCINLVVDEIACDYFPLLHTESIASTDKKINFSNLTKTILKIHSLKTSGGFNIAYKLYPTYLGVDSDRTYYITYSYAPTAPLTVDNNLEVVSSILTARIVAYGVAREYCIYKLMFDQADYYNDRFTMALENARTKKSAIKLPKRRWV